MCGVCGFATGKGFEKAGLDRMVDTMAHRGPDDRGISYFGSTGLGFRRLSILDIEGGHQPMTGEDGRVVAVMNGEIYNYRELRERLVARGHVFRSQSDAEVVPHLYEEGGMEALSRDLRGMFALAVLDRKTGALHLMRDHFGIKPLYYALARGGLYFASDIRSILASGQMTAAVDPTSLWHYLTFQYVPDPRTMFAGILKLPAAHYLTWQDGQMTLTRYWELRFEPDPQFTLSHATDAIYDVLKGSVRRHMMSDVPRGAYLSSGIDSSAVVSFLRQHQSLDTFSIGFGENHGEVDELSLARDTARFLDTRHHEVQVGAAEYRDMLPRIIAAQEDPIADPSAPALYFLAREARRHVTVVLSGEGADELFAGYPIYAEPYALRPFDYLPGGMRRIVGQVAAALPPGVKGRGYLMRGAQTLEERYLGNAKIFNELEKAVLVPWIAPEARVPYGVVTAPYYEASNHLDAVSQMQTIDGYTWLPGDILMKADKMSMAHSLELRVPFLDVSVFEVAAKLPLEGKLGRGTTKLALRQALSRDLPPAMAQRPKLGFPIPIRHWLKHELSDLTHDILSPRNTPYFNPNEIQSLLHASDRTVFNQSRKVWTLLVFALWHQTFMMASPHTAGLKEVHC